MKTLIYGGCFADTEFKVEMVTLWARLVRHLNPDTDIALFDSASPFDPQIFVPKKLNISVHRFEENVGHLSHGGGDGAGRTLCEGLQYAIDHDYDYAVHLGTDMFFAKSAEEDVAKRMSLDALACVCLPNSLYQFPEWELSGFECQWAMESGFIDKYDWKSVRGPFPQVPRPSLLKKYVPEWRLQEAAGDALWLLPYWGIRNDKNQVNFMNLHDMCPYEPPTWLHMGQDIRLFHRFLELNGIDLNAGTSL